jgi:hypothetical protein
MGVLDASTMLLAVLFIQRTRNGMDSQERGDSPA